MKKKIFILLILLLLLLLSGCREEQSAYNTSIIIGRQKNILYIYNLGETRNDDKKWTQIDLNNDLIKDVVETTAKMDFKTGDKIIFEGSGFGGWHELKDFKIISHDNPIPNSK